jgi:hypothetical protein
MIFNFRPDDDPRNRDGVGEPVEWADNWLSNGFAWASSIFTPTWCQGSEDGQPHWTIRVEEWLFTSCPCCFGMRFFTLGVIAGLILFGPIGAILAWLALK